MTDTKTTNQAASLANQHITNADAGTQAKVLTIAIPAYNSESYLGRCIDSLVAAKNAARLLEVLVVNDGSKDATLQIAKNYENKFPAIVRALDQENKGWGGAVNYAIKEAQGKYFYVVDSDDFLDSNVLEIWLSTLNSVSKNAQAPIDLFLCNFVYNHISDASQHTISYRKLFPDGKIITWDEMQKPSIDQYLMIHSMCFRTQIIRDSKLILPHNMAYMDSILALHPLPLVKTLYYADIDLYYYTIGREGQSIEIEVLKKQIDQQITAVYLAIDDLNYEELQQTSQRLADCATRYLSAMLTVSAIYLFKINTKECIAMVDEVWNYLKNKDPKMYDALRFSLAWFARRKTLVGRACAKTGYNLAKMIFKFA